MEVMLMNFNMLGKLIDAPCQDRDLYFRRTGISFVHAGAFDNCPFFFNSQSHALRSPPILRWGITTIRSHYSMVGVLSMSLTTVLFYQKAVDMARVTDQCALHLTQKER